MSYDRAITVNLAERINGDLDSKDDIRLLFNMLNNVYAGCVTFDWSGVKFISENAGKEYLNQVKKASFLTIEENISDETYKFMKKLKLLMSMKEELISSPPRCGKSMTDDVRKEYLDELDEIKEEMLNGETYTLEDLDEDDLEFYKSTQEALDEYDFEFIERRMSEEEFLKELERWQS